MKYNLYINGKKVGREIGTGQLKGFEHLAQMSDSLGWDAELKPKKSKSKKSG